MRRLFFGNTKHTWDWLSAILLIALMATAAARLVATLWTLSLGIVMFITFLATILGLLLGKSTYRRFWVVLIAVAYGVIMIAWQLGVTLDPDLRWRDRFLNLWGRLQIVIQELVTRKPVTDSLLFLIAMAALFYALSIYAGVVLIRDGNPWKVVIPAGVAAFVINSFDQLLAVRSLYLAVYLLIALFLVSRLVYLRNASKWTKRRAHTPPEIGFELSRVALVLSLVLVFFAWNLPVIADTVKPVSELWQSTSRPWLSLKDRFSYIFASLQASASTVQNFYSGTLPLGLGSNLSNQVIMEVQAPTKPPDGTRYYWEARTYDTYQNNTWSSSIQSQHPLTPSSEDLKQPGVDNRTVVSFTFFPFQTISNIYTVSEPLWTSVPSEAFMKINSDGTVDLSALTSNAIIRPGDQYTVRSAMDSVTVLELQNAGTDYPSSITGEYLQLPKTTTPRMIELAKTIAAGSNNPYDITNAVTQYLRENIQYDQTVSKPPADQDRIDWFLFDYKRGFCNYYATAEVILLRSLGIPARMAVGFAQGQEEINASPQALPPGALQEIQQNEATTSTFVVRQNNAHAWPEVYFPNIGWVIFEPTVSQTAFARPAGAVDTSYSQIQAGRGHAPNIPQELDTPRQLPDHSSSTTPSAPKSFWTTGYIILFVLAQFVIGITIIIIWQVLRGVRLYSFLERVSIQVPVTVEKGFRRLGIPPPKFLSNWIFYLQLPPISRDYLEINHALNRVGATTSPQDTPTERANLLTASLPNATMHTDNLLLEYQRSVYSRHPGNREIARLSALEIRKLSWRAWIDRLLVRLRLKSK